MTDQPEHVSNREAAEKALKVAHVIVESLLATLGDYDQQFPSKATDELERSVLVTATLAETFQPNAWLTIATAAVLQLEKALAKGPVAHLAD